MRRQYDSHTFCIFYLCRHAAEILDFPRKNRTAGKPAKQSNHLRGQCGKYLAFDPGRMKSLQGAVLGKFLPPDEYTVNH